MCAPSAIRTRDLLLRSNTAVDAVAISDGAGHASDGTYCCSPSYLVIDFDVWTVPTGANGQVSELGPERVVFDRTAGLRAKP